MAKLAFRSGLGDCTSIPAKPVAMFLRARLAVVVAASLMRRLPSRMRVWQKTGSL